MGHSIKNKFGRAFDVHDIARLIDGDCNSLHVLLSPRRMDVALRSSACRAESGHKPPFTRGVARTFKATLRKRPSIRKGRLLIRRPTIDPKM